jgi:hypothetical protein
MQDRIEESRLRNQMSTDIRKHLEEREKELLAYREQIQKQEMELDAYRNKLKQEQLEREKELQKELMQRERFFSDREKMLSERQKEFEKHLLARQRETEEIRNNLETELAKRESELQKISLELQKEKARYNEESRKKIEKTSNDYVAEALDILNTKEIEFHARSKSWAAIGAFSLVCGLIFFIYVTLVTFDLISDSVTWQFISFSAFKGLIALALFAALAKYSLLFSNSYMREALKNADRRHAINFGKFYLESYGAAADWSQIKEAFEHWNIKGDNAFQGNNSRFDVSTLEKIASAVDKINKSIPITAKE